MNLILSGEYCSQELCNEIGIMPPAFLPMRNKRLYELQFEIIKKFGDETFLSVPKCYKLSHFDRKNLNKLQVKIIFVPYGLTLSESIAFCVKKINFKSHLRILHGDTLFDHIPDIKKDFFSIGETSESFMWGVLANQKENEKKVLTGFFLVTKKSQLLQCLKENPKSFVNALDAYSRQTQVDLVELNKWYDLGHRNSYFKHRLHNVLSRSFNTLDVHKNYLIKKSSNIEKISSEFNWYKQVPMRISMHTPKLAKELEKCSNSASYGIETVPGFSLSDLFVYGNQNKRFWNKIYAHLKELLSIFYQEGNKCRCELVSNEDLSDIHSALYLGKTLDRLTTYESMSGKDMSEYKVIVKQVDKFIPKVSKQHLAFSHGDLCLSNILYNSHNDRLYIIDPRGMATLKSHRTISDLRYDISKLFHSFVGGYDYIIANQFSIDNESIKFAETVNASMQEIFLKFKHLIIPNGFNISMREMISINVMLFASMIPLHDESTLKQNAFLANVKRLYMMLDIE